MKKFFASASAAALLLALASSGAGADEFGTILHGQSAAASVGDTDELYILLGGTTPGRVLGTKFLRPGGDAGTPSAISLLNGTGLPISTGVSGLGAGVATWLATPSSANFLTALTTKTGTGLAVFGTSPTLTTPNLGTPSALTLTNATGLPISTGVSGLGASVATFLGTPSSANLLTALTTKTGTGNAVFGTGPTLTGLIVGDVTGSTQCLHVNTSGLITGTGSDCGAGGGSLTVAAPSFSLGSVSSLTFGAGYVGTGSSGAVTINSTVPITDVAGTTYTVGATSPSTNDAGLMIHFTNGSPVTVTLLAGATVGNGWSENFLCDAGCVFNRAGSDTINGATSLTTAAHQTVSLVSEGTAALSGVVGPALDPSNASNLTAGKVPNAQGGAGTLTGVLRATGGAVSTATLSGSSSTLATASGTLTSTHAAVFDASGNIIDGGVTPGGSGSWNLTDTVTPLTAVTALTVDHTAFTVGGTAGAATLGPLCPAGVVNLTDANGTTMGVGGIVKIPVTLNAPRSYAMPPIASYPAGCRVTIVDTARTVSGTNTATIARNADAATLNLGTTFPAISVAGFSITWESDGSNWSSLAPAVTPILQAGQIYYGSASNQTTAGTPTGDVIPNSSNLWSIQNGVVTNAKAATMAGHSYKGNNTGSIGAPLDLTATQFTAELNVMGGDAGSGGVKGLVPAQVTGDAAKFLKGDGTWATASGGTGCVPGGSAGQILTDSGAGACTSNATLTDLSGVVTATQAFALSGSISPTALVADVNDYAPSGNSTAVRLRMDAGGADRNVTGLANGASGITKIIYNAGATNNLTVVDESASSSAANRFHLGGNNITVAPGKARAFLYDATLNRWTNIDAALGNTGVTASSYTNMNATVSTDGRVTAASNGNPQFMAITSTPSTNATRFTALSGSFSTGEPAMLFPRTATVKSITASLSADPSSGQSYAFTVRKNAADTALTCTVTGNGSTGTTCTLATDISFLTTDKFSVKAVGSASATAGIAASLIFEIQ